MIRHKKQLTQPDMPDATKVRPSDWNDTHTSPAWVVPMVNASVTWTNMPSAATEFTGLPRTRYDLTSADDVRLIVCVGVAGAASSTLRIQYSTNQSAWVDLTPTVAVNATGVRESAWAAVPAGAKADVFLRILGQSGDGTVDPQFRLVQLQAR